MLSKNENRILRHSYKKFIIAEKDFPKDINTVMSLVERKYLVQFKEVCGIANNGNTVYMERKYRITDQGRAYMESRHKRWIEKWWPLILSTIALLKSFENEIISGMQAIVQLLTK